MPTETKILVTGFGPFRNIATNPSDTIVRSLPSTHPSDPSITIIAPASDLRVSYDYSLSAVPALLKEHQPDLVLHVGLDATRKIFAIERSAAREGYHEALDVDGKVFSKARSRELWGKEAERLVCALDLDKVGEKWVERFRRGEKMVKSSRVGRGKAAAGGGASGASGADATDGLDLRVTDNVGTYICGFVYFLSLVEMGKREAGRGKRDVLFCHVPWMEKSEDIEKGVRIVLALIEAMVDVWREEKTTV